MTKSATDLLESQSKGPGTGEILAGVCGVVLVVLLFLPWFTWTASGITITTTATGSTNPGGNLNAWSFFEGMAYVFLVTAILAVFLALFRRRLPGASGAATGAVVGVLGVVLIGLTVWNILTHPLVDVDRGSITIMGMDTAPAYGSYLGVIAALGVSVGGFLSIRHSRD